MKKQPACIAHKASRLFIDKHDTIEHSSATGIFASRQSTKPFRTRTQSAYVPNRSVTREESYRYTEAIRLGNEARKLKKQISTVGEKWLLFWFTALSIYAPASLTALESQLVAASDCGIAVILDELEEIGSRALHEFVERNRKLAPWVVNMCIKAPMTDEQREDAIGDAYEILVQVASSGEYDPSRSSFAHFYMMKAVPQIYERINAGGCIKFDNFSARVKIALDAECAKFYQANQREADFYEQATMLPDIIRNLGKKPRGEGYGPADIALYRSMEPAGSLNGVVGEDGCELSDLIAATARMEDEEAYQAAFDQLRLLVNECLGVLSERDREIVLERCLEPEYRMTFEQIAQKYGITRARAQQIFGDTAEKAEAIKKIAAKCDLDSIRALRAHVAACGALAY